MSKMVTTATLVAARTLIMHTRKKKILTAVVTEYRNPGTEMARMRLDFVKASSVTSHVTKMPMNYT